MQVRDDLPNNFHIIKICRYNYITTFSKNIQGKCQKSIKQIEQIICQIWHACVDDKNNKCNCI